MLLVGQLTDQFILSQFCFVFNKVEDLQLGDVDAHSGLDSPVSMKTIPTDMPIGQSYLDNPSILAVFSDDSKRC